MNEIKCQDCGPEEEGCGTCGGYKIVLGKSQCGGCNKECWVRPGVHTSYKGKTWRTFDGLQMVQVDLNTVRCFHCSIGRAEKGPE